MAIVERFKMDIGPLSPKEVEKAKRELRECPEVCEKEIEKLRKLIQDEPGLVWNTSDEFLKVFLRPTHYYAESAFELIKRICDFRTKYATVLADLNVVNEREYMKSNVVNVLPERDQEGRRVLLVHCGSIWDPYKVNTDHLFRMLYLVHLAATLENSTQVNGVVVIMDFKGMGMKQVTAFSPGFSFRLLTFIQHAMPIRLKAVHIVKEPFVFNIVFKIFKPFIQDKLKNRMFFHGNNMKKLHEHVDPNYLPEDYGGKLPKIDYGGAEWTPAILPHDDYLKSWDNYGYDKNLKNEIKE